MTNETISPAVRRMEEEHERLAEVFVKLDGKLSLEDLQLELRRLSPLLAEHFESEEADDGFFWWIEDEAPHRSEEAHRLTDEHGTFLEQLEGIRRSLDELLDGPVAEVRARVRKLLADLRAHEKAENELATSALWTDIGGGS